MMGFSRKNKCFLIIIIVVCLSVFLDLSASSNLSSDADVIFEPQFPSQRRLLQALKPCPVNFGNQNYSIITSQCKEPYSSQLCCSSFKEFACPFVDYLNDSLTDCSQVMFGYINAYGKYPQGLFSSFCREGKEGLSCPDQPSSSSPEKYCGSQIICEFLTATMIVAATLCC